MNDKVMFSKARCALLGMASALVLFSEVSVAESYHSAVNFPYLHSAGQVHRVNIPASVNAPDHIKVKSVSWSWTQPSVHQRYRVHLCQMVTNICKDISYQKAGTSTGFGRGDAAVHFYFTVQGVGRPFNPAHGLRGSLTVNW